MMDSDSKVFINGNENGGNPLNTLPFLIPALILSLIYYFVLLPIRFLTMDSVRVRVRVKGKRVLFPTAEKKYNGYLKLGLP